MTPDKIVSVIEKYEAQLSAAHVPKVRMDPKRYFRDLTADEMLAHAHYTCENVKKFARDPDLLRKTGSHLAVVQMCLSFAGWYTLDDLMTHNRSDELIPMSRPTFVPGITNFREPVGMT